MKYRISNEYWIEAESQEKAMEKFGALYKEDDWVIEEVANAEAVEDDLFCFFGSVLNRINDARKAKGEAEYTLLDKEVNEACRKYHKDHPRDYMLMAED